MLNMRSLMPYPSPHLVEGNEVNIESEMANVLLNIQQDIQRSLDSHGESALTLSAVGEFKLKMHCYKAIVLRIFQYFSQVPIKRTAVFRYTVANYLCENGLLDSIGWIPIVKPIIGRESQWHPLILNHIRSNSKKRRLVRVYWLVLFCMFFATQLREKACETQVSKMKRPMKRSDIRKICGFGFDPKRIGNIVLNKGFVSIELMSYFQQAFESHDDCRRKRDFEQSEFIYRLVLKSSYPLGLKRSCFLFDQLRSNNKKDSMMRVWEFFYWDAHFNCNDISLFKSPGNKNLVSLSQEMVKAFGDIERFTCHFISFFLKKITHHDQLMCNNAKRDVIRAMLADALDYILGTFQDISFYMIVGVYNMHYGSVYSHRTTEHKSVRSLHILLTFGCLKQISSIKAAILDILKCKHKGEMSSSDIESYVKAMTRFKEFAQDISLSNPVYSVTNVMESVLIEAFCSIASYDIAQDRDINESSDMLLYSIKSGFDCFRDYVLFVLDSHASKLSRPPFQTWLFYRATKYLLDKGELLYNGKTFHRIKNSMKRVSDVLELLNPKPKPECSVLHLDIVMVLKTIKKTFVPGTFYSNIFHRDAIRKLNVYTRAQGVVAIINIPLLLLELNAKAPFSMTSDAFKEICDTLKMVRFGDHIGNLSQPVKRPRSMPVQRPRLGHTVESLSTTSGNNATTQDQSDTRKRVSSGGDLSQPVQRPRLGHTVESLSTTSGNNVTMQDQGDVPDISYGVLSQPACIKDGVSFF